MNLEKLHELEGRFFAQYPDGFDDEALSKIGKRHNIEKATGQTREAFKKTAFKKPEIIAQGMTQLVSRSSMVSMFEKPKFRDAIQAMSKADRAELVSNFKNILHSRSENVVGESFDAFIEQLAEVKMARWSVATILPFYYAPETFYFIKPNTTKAILNYFEIEELAYKPRPSYDFYKKYTDILDTLKANTDSRLTPNNAAFTGFFMMTIN